MDKQTPRGPTDRDSIESAVRGLEQALAGSPAGREKDWAAQLDQTLADVKRAVQQRDAELKTGGGQLVDVEGSSMSSPTEGRLAEGLRHELDGVVAEVAALRSEAAKPAPDLAAFRSRAARLLDVLRHFAREEGGMIQEAVNRDIGGGD